MIITILVIIVIHRGPFVVQSARAHAACEIAYDGVGLIEQRGEMAGVAQLVAHRLGVVGAEEQLGARRREGRRSRCRGASDEVRQERRQRHAHHFAVVV